MKLILLNTIRTAIISVVFIFFMGSIIYAQVNQIVDSQNNNLNSIILKISELKSLEKIIDQKLQKLKKDKIEVNKERSILNAKKKELDAYVTSQQNLLKSLKKNITAEKIKKLAAIYSHASPDAAAQELSNMNPKLAAAILTFMMPRQAGAIVSQMDPKKASSIFQIYIENKHK